MSNDLPFMLLCPTFVSHVNIMILFRSGTGKSSTIVGLVSALLSGKAPLPKQRQSGCLIHPGKTFGATFAEPQARNRILVCAATNQAVDSLAWKIKQGSRKFRWHFHECKHV